MVTHNSIQQVGCRRRLTARLIRNVGRKMMRIHTQQSLALFLGMFAWTAFSSDVVTLKSGKVIECHVLEYSAEQFKVVDTKGKTTTGNASAVESIVFEPPQEKEKADSDPVEEEPNIEVVGSFGGICETPEQKAELTRFAVATFDRPIKSIGLVHYHPGGHREVRVNFERVKIQGDYYSSPSAVICHTKLLPSWAARDKDGNVTWDPKKSVAVSGPWFTDKKIKINLRVRYRLKSMAKYLGSPDRLGSYDAIHKLLLSIEAKDYEIPEDSIASRLGKHIHIQLEEIISISTEKEEGRVLYRVKTRSGSLTGEIFTFERRDNTFALVGVGMWVS